MIKANELRIGNYILVDTIGGLPLPHFVNAGDISDLANGRITLSSIEPIPLSPEILIKCGFSKIEDEYDLGYGSSGAVFYSLDGRFPISYKDGDFYKHWHIDEDSWYSFQYPKIEYLHQLQNLYFALTGQELNYQP